MSQGSGWIQLSSVRRHQRAWAGVATGPPLKFSTSMRMRRREGHCVLLVFFFMVRSQYNLCTHGQSIISTYTNNENGKMPV